MKSRPGTKALGGLLITLLCAGASVEHRVLANGTGDGGILPQWQGLWVGQLENAPAQMPGVLVRLTIHEGVPGDGCLTWRSEYLKSQERVGLKDYRLCRDRDGSYSLDEGDGVVLHASLFGNDLYSAFALPENHLALFTHTRLDGDVIVHDIFTAKQPADAASEVVSFQGLSRQRIVFRRERMTDARRIGRNFPN